MGHCELTSVPEHVAIIPDGNRRWARQLGVPRAFGHLKGTQKVVDTVLDAKKYGVSYLTFFAFSTENWRRDTHEIRALMYILATQLQAQVPRMLQEGIRFRTIGNLASIPRRLFDAIEEVRARTCEQKEIDFILAINYGGRDEICRSVNQILHEMSARGCWEPVTEEIIAAHLDTRDIPDPSLIIRAGGEQRMSNFLLWQSAYAEKVTLETLWPSFSSQDLYHALKIFDQRNRRLGG